MKRWCDFAAAEPEMAEAARKLVYQYGIGLGYLATVRRDGAPRLHPICLIQAEDGLYAFIVPSPKRADLDRDGRVAIHACGPDDRDDEFAITGRAVRVTDEAARAAALASYEASGGKSNQSEVCYEFLLETALVASYKKRGEPENWPPRYSKWRA